MSKEARVIWRRLLPLLQSMRVLTLADGNALARYCDLLVTYGKLAEDIATNGVCRETEDGCRARPQHRLRMDTAAELLRLEIQFGFTPSSRSRVIALPPESAEDDKAKFFDGPKLVKEG